ncbi:MAG: ORC1-type DNA replication protein [Candidatus Thermoplasmatota archaeon]|jgi:cell division control protein 6|nr:ORC1-type DNA replication protein [Candidatus Thermoplasmatota archaeon]
MASIFLPVVTMNLFSKFSAESPLIKGDLEKLSGSFMPNSFPHREKEIDHMVMVLSSIMRDMKPSNMLLYGKTGTGKTSTTSYVTSMLKEAAEDRVNVCYVNCQIYDSPYSILVTIVNSISTGTQDQIPPMGWPMDRIYGELVTRMNAQKSFYVLVLDEVDKLIQKNGSDALYVILKILDDTRMSRASIIGITNDANFLDTLDPRVRSRMNQESIMFSSYNAQQLRDIIAFRLEGIVKEGAVDESAVNLCSAIGAQEHGDARKALDLMRISIEIAIRENREKVTDREVYEARDRYEMNVVHAAITSLPLQSKMVLLSAVVTQELSKRLMITGEIYENYRNICTELGFIPLTSRRIGDILSELEEFGLLSATTRSMGRYGRTRFIRVMGDPDQYKHYLMEDENLSHFMGSKITRQSRFENLDGVQKGMNLDAMDRALSDFADGEPDRE